MQDYSPLALQLIEMIEKGIVVPTSTPSSADFPTARTVVPVIDSGDTRLTQGQRSWGSGELARRS